jgi:hypothetical protein
MRVVREFQQTVIEVVREESPETARRIVTRLKARQALRSSADLLALDEGGSHGALA